MGNKTKIRSTTILAVRRNGQVAMAGDGQCTLGETVCKGNSRKVRKIYDGKILTGFAEIPEKSAASVNAIRTPAACNGSVRSVWVVMSTLGKRSVISRLVSSIQEK